MLKSSRSAEARNLISPSLHGFFPEVKATKVGGLALTCVKYLIRDTNPSPGALLARI